jgi:hypothetical protein
MVDISRDVFEMNDVVYPEKGTLPLEIRALRFTSKTAVTSSKQRRCAST